jgi:hypothetical protein
VGETMEYFLREIKKITTGGYLLKNRIDGQFIGSKDDLLSFIGEKFKQNSLVIYEIHESSIDELLKHSADKIKNRYYFYQNISDDLIALLKKTAYIQGLYIFMGNSCVLYAEDNLEDITLTINVCY